MTTSLIAASTGGIFAYDDYYLVEGSAVNEFLPLNFEGNTRLLFNAVIDTKYYLSVIRESVSYEYKLTSDVYQVGVQLENSTILQTYGVSNCSFSSVYQIFVINIKIVSKIKVQFIDLICSSYSLNSKSNCSLVIASHRRADIVQVYASNQETEKTSFSNSCNFNN